MRAFCSHCISPLHQKSPRQMCGHAAYNDEHAAYTRARAGSDTERRRVIQFWKVRHTLTFVTRTLETPLMSLEPSTHPRTCRHTSHNTSRSTQSPHPCSMKAMCVHNDIEIHHTTRVGRASAAAEPPAQPRPPFLCPPPARNRRTSDSARGLRTRPKREHYRICSRACLSRAPHEASTPPRSLTHPPPRRRLRP
jgi:hypothetical protein